MTDDSVLVLCVTLLFVLCLGEPDLLDSLIVYLGGGQ